MYAAARQTTPGQGNIELFGRQTGIQLGIGERLTRVVKQLFDLLTHGVDLRATCFFLFDGQFAQRFELGGEYAVFAQEFGFFVFQVRRTTGAGKCRARLLYDLIQVAHIYSLLFFDRIDWFKSSKSLDLISTL